MADCLTVHVCVFRMVCKAEYKHMFIYFILVQFFAASRALWACLLRFIIYSILSFLRDLIAFVHTHVLLIRLLFFYALRSCVCACVFAHGADSFKKYAVNF